MLQAGDHQTASIIAGCLAVVVIVLRYLGESAWDLGDGALHYLQPRFAHDQIHLYFDRWGKPIFVLLATPFAQLGPIGIVVFNGLVAWLTSYGILAMVRPSSKWLAWMVPVLLFMAVQYFRVVISGLTEPLFGLLTIGCLWLLLKDRYTLAMVLLSLAPFTRPEYAAFAPFVLAWILYKGKWKAIPWVLAGTVVYLTLGITILKERIWTFSKDPYEGVDYGTGPLDYFVTQAPAIVGHVLLVLFCCALPVLIWMAKQDSVGREKHLFMLVCAVAPVLGIWGLHSYAFWNGGFASAGLLRVLATSVPLALLAVAHTGSYAIDRWHWRGRTIALPMLCIGAFSWSAIDLHHFVGILPKASVEQQLVERSAAVIQERLEEGERLYSMHPYLAVVTDRDIGDTTRNARTWELAQFSRRHGDLVEWDSDYRPDSMQNFVGSLCLDTGFTLLSLDVENEGPWQALFSIAVFERNGTAQSWSTDTVIDILHRVGMERVNWKGDQIGPDGGLTGVRLESLEYPLEIMPGATCSAHHVASEWIITAELGVMDSMAEERFLWVFSTTEGSPPMVMQTAEIKNGVSEVRFFTGGRLSDRDMKLYLWNIDKQKFDLLSLTIVKRCASRTFGSNTL